MGMKSHGVHGPPVLALPIHASNTIDGRVGDEPNGLITIDIDCAQYWCPTSKHFYALKALVMDWCPHKCLPLTGEV